MYMYIIWFQIMYNYIFYSFKGQWAKAAEYADKLYSASKWSKVGYIYMVAYMMGITVL